MDFKIITGEENQEVDNLFKLADLKFSLKSSKDKTKQVKEILETIVKNKMLPYYDHLIKETSFLKKDEELIKSMGDENEKKLKELELKIKDAEENLGENEVREALLSKAKFYKSIGDKKNALSSFNVAFSRTVAMGQKIDIVFEKLIISLAFEDYALVKKYIEKAKLLISEGGDWERRNRLKVYEGIYFISRRNFKEASPLLIESISTFSAYELMTYEKFIFYSIITGLITLERPEIKKKLIQSSDVFKVVRENETYSSFLTSLYNCQYKEFLKSLVLVSDELLSDRYLFRHQLFYEREMRVLGYSQFLTSYKGIKIKTMANEFGVSVEFLDRDLSRFIASGRLQCKIDKVGGLLNTNRLDSKNYDYQTTLKLGDALLNRIHKLSRVVDL